MNELDATTREALRALVAALGPAMGEVVIAGGQAARLFRLHRLASAVSWPAVLTNDIDVATADKGHRSSVDLHAALLREGFRANLVGNDEKPPLTRYLRDSIEVELIVPVVPRRKATGATREVLKASAQTVEHLEPLLFEPEWLAVPQVGMLRLPNPAAWLIQKALTVNNRRQVRKKGKDALYLHDVLALFTHVGGLRREVIAQAERVPLSKMQEARLLENVRRLVDPNTDFVIEAARQAEGRALTAQLVALALQLGFRELLPGLL